VRANSRDRRFDWARVAGRPYLPPSKRWMARIECIRAGSRWAGDRSSKRKLAHARACLRRPEAEVEEALRVALHQAIGEPRGRGHDLTPASAHKIQENGRTRLPTMKAMRGACNSCTTTDLANADCRIEWRGGGPSRRAQSAIESALADLMARPFSRKAPPERKEIDMAENDDVGFARN